jgi:hypothetical protein
LVLFSSGLAVAAVVLVRTRRRRSVGTRKSIAVSC